MNNLSLRARPKSADFLVFTNIGSKLWGALKIIFPHMSFLCHVACCKDQKSQFSERRSLELSGTVKIWREYGRGSLSAGLAGGAMAVDS